MKFNCKTQVHTKKYEEDLKEFKDKLQEYDELLEKYGGDEALFASYSKGIEVPDMPEPPLVDSIICVKKEFIYGYEVLEKSDEYEEEEVIKVFVDKSKITYPYIIATYDDKIIKQLDQLLGE